MSEIECKSLQGSVRLTDWGVIRAQGEDAASFLHGQLTQDVQHLDRGQARLGGYCSAKGRLLASLLIWRGRDDELLLACSADVLPATLKRLSMYVLRARCQLSDASTAVALYGLAGPAATAWLGAQAPGAVWQRGETANGGEVIRLPDGWAGAPLKKTPGRPKFSCAPVGGRDGQGPALGGAHEAVARYLLALPAAAAPPDLPSLPAGAWSWLEVASGVARIVAATVEQFVPQMVNFEQVGGVNFQKGCYPGQEVVARSQYRGSVKRRAFVFMLEGPARAGQEVFHSLDPEQPAGRVVNAASWNQSHGALVEVKLEALAAGTLHLGSAAGPRLHRAAHQPYAPPEATDATDTTD